MVCSSCAVNFTVDVAGFGRVTTVAVCSPVVVSSEKKDFSVVLFSFGVCFSVEGIGEVEAVIFVVFSLLPLVLADEALE